MYDNRKEITIRLSRRELGLMKFLFDGMYARIDSDVTSWGSSCTGHDVIAHDDYGKDAIIGICKEVFKASSLFDKEQLTLPKDKNGNRNPVPL